MTKLKSTIISVPLTITALVILVIVGIYLALTIKQANQVEEPTAVTSNQSTSNTTNTATTTEKTADWQIYTNDQYAFSFKYPKGWNLKGELNKFLTLEDSSNCYRWSPDASDGNPPCVENIFISIFKNKYNAADAESYLEKYFNDEINSNSAKELNFSDFYESFSKLPVNDYQFEKFISIAPIDGSKSPTYWLKLPDNNFLSFEARYINNKDQQLRNFDQILASFKFTNQSSKEVNDNTFVGKLESAVEGGTILNSDNGKKYLLIFPENFSSKNKFKIGDRAQVTGQIDKSLITIQMQGIPLRVSSMALVF